MKKRELRKFINEKMPLSGFDVDNLYGVCVECGTCRHLCSIEDDLLILIDIVLKDYKETTSHYSPLMQKLMKIRERKETASLYPEEVVKNRCIKCKLNFLTLDKTDKFICDICSLTEIRVRK